MMASQAFLVSRTEGYLCYNNADKYFSYSQILKILKFRTFTAVTDTISVTETLCAC